MIKVASYEIGEEAARLELSSGGVMTLPPLRIDRVLDDEVMSEIPAEVQAIAAQPGFTFYFQEGQPVPTTPYGDLIYRLCRQHQLNPQLVAAVIRHESAFNPKARSPKGARGLMQLMPATARRFGVSQGELYNPERNLEAGIRYLRVLCERFPGALEHVLAAYNAGENAVERYAGVPPYRETRTYVQRILGTLGL